jgi:hypothetical protein
MFEGLLMPPAVPPEPFQYWTPGSEDRAIRVFISHRYASDRALYDTVIDKLQRQGHAIQDLSLNEQQQLQGPNGGEVPEMSLQAVIAARIYSADLLIAPSRPRTSRSEWLVWEVQLAAISYGVPVLFVNEPGLVNQTRLVSEIARLGLPYAVCGQVSEEIVRKAIDLVKGRPDWAVRQEETDPSLRFRGPPPAARDTVMRQFPYTPRLPPVSG